MDNIQNPNPNNRFLVHFPKIDTGEYAFLTPFLDRLTEQQAKDFLRMYSESRLDRQTYILLAALGFVFITHGFHRFYVGDWGLGIAHIFTCGFFGIGTIYDMVTAREKVLEVNLAKARNIYSNYGNPYEIY